MSFNKVLLLGYIGADPVIRYPEKDKPIVYASLATNEILSDGQSEITEWHNLVFNGNNAQIAERFVRKGSRLFIEGKIRTREYEDRMKILRKRTEIIVEKIELLGRSKD